MAIALSAAAFLMTLLGGLLALKLQDRLHLILGFSAGAVIGVAFFDLIPEAVSLTGTRGSASMTVAVVAIGFVAYMILDRTVAPHGHKGERVGLRPRHARLAVNAAMTWCSVMLDTLADTQAPWRSSGELPFH